MNSIVNLKTVNAESPDGPAHVVVMGLDIPDLSTAEDFIKVAAEKFKLQRMCSPPTTSNLLITIIGAIPVERFIERWRAIAAADEILRFFMSQMKNADILRGTAEGEVLERGSLVGRC